MINNQSMVDKIKPQLIDRQNNTDRMMTNNKLIIKLNNQFKIDRQIRLSNKLMVKPIINKSKFRLNLVNSMLIMN